MLPHAPWLVWVIPAVSSLFVPIVARLGGKARECFAVAVGLVATVLAASMVTDVYFASNTSNSSLPWIPSLGVNAGVLVDPLSALFASLVAFFSLVVMIYSIDYMADQENLTRYYFFMLLFMSSMIGLVMSDNFLQMFIFWEMVGLCSYSLISFWYRRAESARAGVKVFLMTRVGDVFLLAAIALLYANLGSFSFSYITAHVENVPLPTLTAVAFLMLGGAVAKSAQLPFHAWLYAAMEAPTSVSALLHSATMVKAGVYLIARLILLFGPLTASVPMWSSSVLWIGAITTFVGATSALSTPDIKGVAAYSTVSQIGFMFTALGTAHSASSPGWFAGLLHLVSHALFQGLDFLLIGGIIHATKTRDMRLMGGLRKAMPITFGLGIVVMLARVGMPPFISFFSKEMIFQSVLSSGNLHAALLLYVSTAITFAYTLRATVLVYVREKSDYLEQVHPHEAPRMMLFSAGVLAVLCTVASLFGEPVSQLMRADVEIGLNEVLSPSTLIFLFTVFVGGSTYLVCCRKTSLAERLGQAPRYLNRILENGYFFDAFYEKVVARCILSISSGLKWVEMTVFGPMPHIFVGRIVSLSNVVNERVEKSLLSRLPYLLASCIVRLSNAIHENLEKSFLDRLPYLVANGVTILAHSTRYYLDVSADGLLYMITNKTLASASEIQKMRSGSIARYISAALIGLLIILVLTALTMLR
jgi:NADH-quinone oxidoreductase subunit L